MSLVFALGSQDEDVAALVHGRGYSDAPAQEAPAPTAEELDGIHGRALRIAFVGLGLAVFVVILAWRFRSESPVQTPDMGTDPAHYLPNSR